MKMSSNPALLRFLASSLLVLCIFVPVLVLLIKSGFPAPELTYLVSPSEVDRQLPFLLWGDRLMDLLAQVALMLLAAAVCTSAMRLWGGRGQR